MTVPSAVRLANDIAAQFHHLPPEQAAQAVADHIHTFWDPRMTRSLRDLVEQGGQGDLDPIALAATGLLPV